MAENQEKGTGRKRQPFRFGVMADLHYSSNNQGTAMGKLEVLVAAFNAYSPEFVIQLGDIIAGHENDIKLSDEDLRTALSVYNRLNIPAYNVIGNHCLDAGKVNVHRRLNMERFYYRIPSTGAVQWRFLVLDGNDAGLGIIGKRQMDWFSSELDDASRNEEKVIVFCHFALLEEAAQTYRMEEPRPLLEIIDKAGNVAAWFAGHDHKGGYTKKNGVHHLTFRGLAETDMAYAITALHNDRIEITGFGNEPHRNLHL
jgi:manganese-dependent ADP-ribose/CDP-alcohol diphosphatase